MVKKLFFISIILLSLTACGKRDGEKALSDNVIEEATLLQMERLPDCTVVTVSDPWSKERGKVLHRYVLVDKTKPLPDNLPEGTMVRVPLDSALVYSSVHSGVFKELGRVSAITGVVDAQYFNDDEISDGLAAGKITDCGSSMAPSVEKVISMSPDAILLSPYQDATYGQITKLNIPIIECADYMETTPLGRAEWIKFYGELIGKGREADSIYNAVKDEYTRIKHEIAREVTQRPTVLTESIISGVWNVPGGHSYMAILINDAGGDYPWADDKHTGSLSLDFDQVLAKAAHADVWLIKSMSIHSLNDLRAAHRLNNNFDAFKNGNVYVCDTGVTHFFDRFPFHPDLLLREYATIFHPTLFSGNTLQFFKPIR